MWERLKGLYADFTLKSIMVWYTLLNGSGLSKSHDTDVQLFVMLLSSSLRLLSVRQVHQGFTAGNHGLCSLGAWVLLMSLILSQVFKYAEGEV